MAAQQEEDSDGVVSLGTSDQFIDTRPELIGGSLDNGCEGSRNPGVADFQDGSWLASTEEIRHSV